MLTLNDGRSELWQWDTGRTLAVDADCSQVHFSNKVFGRSIDVDVIDGVAIVPDILLQTDKELNVWAFVGTAENGYTKISKTFKVNRRNKPADYVFTPPDQTSLEEIKERIDALEEAQDPDAIKNAVGDYLEQNPVEVPVQSVNGKTGEVELTATDVGAISQDDLQNATNEALAQAKASGEFDGKDGVSATHEWNGTVLTVTSASGTSSADLKGDKGDTGATGAQGEPGKDGEPGSDYILTDADKTEIAEQAAELVEVPESTMQPLTFTGAVSATYDGSKAVTVEIPEGGGSGGGDTDELLLDFTTTEEVQEIKLPLTGISSRINSAAQLKLYLHVERPVADEGTEMGKIDAHLFRTWNLLTFFSELQKSPSNATSWVSYTNSVSFVTKNKDGIYYAVNSGEVKNWPSWTELLNSKGGGYANVNDSDNLIITSTLPMGVGTRVKLYARGYL